MLPDKYKFLDEIGKLPKLVSAAIQYLGVKEIPGSASNPVIIEMARSLGISDIYTNDDLSWCAVFINNLIKITGKPIVDYKKDRYNLLRAKYLLNWGEPVELKDALLGDIVIIDRVGGGHVFILIGFTKEGNLIGIGGNQSNKVSFSEFDKDRVLGARRFYATGIPASAKKYILDSDGVVSTNEA